jgi:hypothetical protein
VVDFQYDSRWGGWFSNEVYGLPGLVFENSLGGILGGVLKYTRFVVGDGL